MFTRKKKPSLGINVVYVDTTGERKDANLYPGDVFKIVGKNDDTLLELRYPKRGQFEIAQRAMWIEYSLDELQRFVTAEQGRRNIDQWKAPR